MSEHAGYIIFLESWAKDIEHRHIAIEFGKKVPALVSKLRETSPVGLKVLEIVHSNILMAQSLYEHFQASHLHDKWYQGDKLRSLLDQASCSNRSYEQRQDTYCIGCFLEKHRDTNNHYPLVASQTWPEMVIALNRDLQENYLLPTDASLNQDHFKQHAKHNERFSKLLKANRVLKSENQKLQSKVEDLQIYTRALEERLGLEARKARRLRSQKLSMCLPSEEDYLAAYLDGLDDLE